MTKERPNPDALLASLKKEEAKQKRGKLKIFLGMCPGVGKTYAMLQAARQRDAEGIDVLVGVAETHGRKETEALLDGLAIASKVKRSYRGTEIEEMDLDTVLAIRPQLAIVDELAHTNAPGSRHPKRYQDVLEILAAGIDVYTTLNVQHVESRAETVYQITGIRVTESVPDSLLDEADEVALIDISPEQLRQRLKEGKVYMGERAVTAADNFFREENLTALREMVLRVTAERVNQDLREIMTEQRIQGPWKTGERLMVAIGPTPYSESLIRWTRRAAAQLNAPWVAVYVETSHTLDDDEKKKLARNLSLARQLGAEVIVRSGTDLAETLLLVARENNVSQICVGKPSDRLFFKWTSGAAFIQRLIRGSGDIDIHMVRIKSLGSEKGKKGQGLKAAIPHHELRMVFGVVLGVTVFCLGLERITGYSSVALIYLLSVVVAGLFLSRWSVLLLAACSALLWNYLFIPPKYTFAIYKNYDVMMFVMYFAVAMVMGGITTRLREREKAERKQEARVNLLYQLTKIIALTHNTQQAIDAALSKIEDAIKVQAAIFLLDAKGKPDFEQPRSGKLLLSSKERSVATWTFHKREAAGRFTETLPEAENFYLPLVSLDKTLGVLAVKPMLEKIWTLDQRNLMDSFGALLSVILEKDLLAKMAEEAKVKLESEKLQSALFDSVSHELKTPLTVIAGSAEHLAKPGLAPEQFSKLVAEIRAASHRLLQTVNGLLSMTRLDSEKLQLNYEWHDVRDVLNEVLEDLKELLVQNTVDIKYEAGLPVVKFDAAIIKQILVNLVSNAAMYSPKKSQIMIAVNYFSGELRIFIRDQGNGISEEDMDKIFEKFYRGKNSRAGGLGLGLSIAKRFAQAHGGDIEAGNREDGPGAEFILRIPVENFKSEEKSSL